MYCKRKLVEVTSAMGVRAIVLYALAGVPWFAGSTVLLLALLSIFHILIRIHIVTYIIQICEHYHIFCEWQGSPKIVDFPSRTIKTPTTHTRLSSIRFEVASPRLAHHLGRLLDRTKLIVLR